MYLIEYKDYTNIKAIFVEKKMRNLVIGLLRLRYVVIAETFIEI